MNKLYVAVGVVLGVTLYRRVNSWKPPETAGPYLDDIQKAELQNGLPKNLLARLLYQESRYREDIISGELKSGAGAVGIAQIVPKWHPNVNPLDPIASIYYAAGYLKQNIDKFGGSLEKGLAAYNWGPSNVLLKGLSEAPEETRNYYTEILNDVG